MMIIRESKLHEVDRLIEIWYLGSTIAHDFIDADYWKSQKQDMKDKYLPMATTHMITDEKEIYGFISMVDDYLAALFIDNKYQGQGYGKRLLDYIKGQRNSIQLKVYTKNENAVRFYLNHQFVIQAELEDENTGEKEYLMEWRKGSE